MFFALGYIAGIATAALIAAVLAFFKKPIERIIETAQKQIEVVGPRPRGYLLDAEDEGDIARQEIVRRNRERGRDTPISELR